MCGIVGIKDEVKCPGEEDILSMRDSVNYRGPDGYGHVIFTDDNLAIGHRRLSILDPSPSGAQPMYNDERTIVVVHNGEIYNFIELRKELEEFGYKFKTGTDTEVIVAAYDHWQEECICKFNGMFAFAIWDKRKRKLLIARDRIGIKPLYYWFDGQSFVFASETKALLAVMGNKPSINVSLIDTYMSFGYIPGEETLFNGIKRLLPGHYLTLKQNTLVIKKYWDFQFTEDQDLGIDHYVENLKHLLENSIELRLRSDVPLGIFLSGGIDSSAVVALLAPRVSERLKTFSVAYDFGNAFNETNYAKMVAKEFNTDHHELIITPNDFKNFIPQYIWHMDEPVTESAAISLYYVARLAKNHVSVVLSGEGADELFAGYDFYYYMRMIENYKKVLGSKAVPIVNNILLHIIHNEKFRKYIRLSRLPLEERYKGISTYEEETKDQLYNLNFKEQIKHGNGNMKCFLSSLFKRTIGKDALSRMLYFDTKTWLVDDLLIKADRMSMAPSLELRVPFLDHRIVEFAATIPSKHKLRGRTPKYILKKMMKGILPDTIIQRKKMGFPTPLKVMFKDQLYDYADDILLSQKAVQRGYFNKNTIKKLLTEHRNGYRDNHRVIWQLLVLEEWHRKFVD
ncbi:MAG: asparagine synthase (glutamine-hydrolyzing) [Planctomycetota bacterium]|jgi:asparagine synthase (glutamine-hydrolysing)